MPVLEFTFRATVSEKTLAKVRELQEFGEFGAHQAVDLLRNSTLDVTLLSVSDENR